MSDNELTRRRFLTRVGQGVAAASLSAGLLKSAAAQLRVPDPPGKKLAWAIVGLGSLAINQILPVSAQCEHSRPVAFVSGHPSKANKLALRYGVDPAPWFSGEEEEGRATTGELPIYFLNPDGHVRLNGQSHKCHRWWTHPEWRNGRQDVKAAAVSWHKRRAKKPRQFAEEIS